MQKIRAKFHVNNVRDLTQSYDPSRPKKYGEQVDAHPVYSSDPTSENYDYSQATPSGDLSLTITNPDAFGFFQPGGEVVIEFTPAEVD